MSIHKKILDHHHKNDQQKYQQQIPQLQQQQFQQIPPPIESTKSNIDELVSKFYQTNSYTIRATSAVFPSDKATYSDSRIPFAIAITPYGDSVEQGFPSVTFGNYPILRCDNCRAYLNPYMKINEEKKSFQCNLCTLFTTFKYEYRLSPDRLDLTQGAYDIKAGAEYQARPPMPPIYFFMVDVSARSQGILPMLGQVVKQLILENQFKERTLFGFLTFDTVVHVYNFNPILKQAQMFVLGDSQDYDLPIPGEFLFSIEDSKDIIIGFLDNLGSMFYKSQQVSTQFMRALKISHKILLNTGGNLIMVNSSPINELKTNTNEKDKNYMLPSSPVLSNLASEMHFHYICPSLFIISPSQYMNTITQNQLIRFLNGNIFYYDDFDNYVQKFFYDFKNMMSKDYSWESVFRIRPSLGWRVKQIYGNYSIKSNDLLSLTQVDGQKTLIYEFELVNPYAQQDILYLQSALLYTNSFGERRIRVQNYALPLTNSIQAIYQKLDPQVITGVILKIGLNQMYKVPKLQDILQFIMNSGKQIIQVSKTIGCAVDDIYAFWLGLIKNQIFRTVYTQSLQTDYSNYLRSLYTYMPIDELMPYIVPQLYRISDFRNEDCEYNDQNQFVYPPQIPLQVCEIREKGIYLLDVGHKIYIFIGRDHDKQMCFDLFGKEYMNVPKLTEDNLYSNSTNPICNKVYYLIQELRRIKQSNYARVQIIREEQEILRYMIYDSYLNDINYQQLVQQLG